MSYQPKPQLPLIERLWAVALSPKSADDERIAALHAIDRHLAETGTDGYAMIERIKTEPVTDAQMQEVFDRGRELGRTENAVVVVPKQPFFSPPGAPSRSSGVYGFEDGDRIGGDDIYKGYPWSAIADHCDANLNRIPDKHHGFLADMADRLNDYETVSGKQAKYLANLFAQYLGGRI
jgi:hypothetical protein